MSNTKDIFMDLGDETLDPAPVQQAYATFAGSCLPCSGCVYCQISDEALDSPEQQAMPCACGFLPCTISDEPLDPAPAQEAAACISPCMVPCMITNISDEALDPAPAQKAMTCCAYPCGVSDEATDAR